MIDCPECGAETETGRRHLTEREYTTTLECTECEFAAESESNLVAQDRRERRADTSDYTQDVTACGRDTHD